MNTIELYTQAARLAERLYCYTRDARIAADEWDTARGERATNKAFKRANRRYNAHMAQSTR